MLPAPCILLAAALDLQPWGDAPFEQAREEGKPALLVVAERGDADLAGLDLARFVAIAVDPLERPDVADLFHTAASLLSEAGSPPAAPTVYLLTPERRPFAAASLQGTALAEFLDRGASDYQERRTEVEARAGAAIALLRESQRGEPARGPLGGDAPARALQGLLDAMDPVRGGFRTTPSELPHGAIRLLMEEAQRTRSADALRLLRATLDGMAASLPRLRLPDDALLLRAYALAHALTGEARYHEVADGIATFCARELEDADGTFVAGLTRSGDVTNRDDRVVAGWNGLMISGLAASGRKADLAAAERAATAVLQRLGPPALLRRFARGDELGGSAFFEDYAYLVDGLLDLAEATGEPRWTDAASSLTAVAESRFLDSDRGGFFDTDDRHGPLPARIRNGYDGELPSANGVMASALLKLARATGESRHAALARKTVEAFLGDLQKAPRGLETLAAAAGEIVGPAEAKLPAVPEPLSHAVRGSVTLEATLSATRVSPGAAIEARVVLSIAKGYSVNAHTPGKDLVGLSVSAPGEDFVASPPRYPEPAQVPRGGGPAPAYVGTATVTVPLRSRAGRAPGEARVRLRVGFQSCDATDCRTPESVILDVPVSIVPAGR